VHAAPPVRVSLGRSAGWAAFVALCVGIAVSNLAAWLLLRLEASISLAILPGAVAAGLAAWRLQRAQDSADLNWNGAEWQWRGRGGDVKVALDLDAWLLLRFEPAHGKRCWIAASRRSATGPWPALRAALYARRPVDPLAGPPP
jgi:hypothetical protein